MADQVCGAWEQILAWRAWALAQAWRPLIYSSARLVSARHRPELEPHERRVVGGQLAHETPVAVMNQALAMWAAPTLSGAQEAMVIRARQALVAQLYP